MIWDIIIKISQYFAELYNRFGGYVKAESRLTNYATKSGVKKQMVIHHLCKKS